METGKISTEPRNYGVSGGLTLIADSGSTKTDWLLRASNGSGTPLRFHTQGINPIHQSDEQIMAVLRDELLPQIGHVPLSAILFYGSGVRPDQEERMEGLLRQCFKEFDKQDSCSTTFPQASPIGMPSALQQTGSVTTGNGNQASLHWGGAGGGLYIEARSDLLGAARALCGDREGLACILGTGANSCLYDGQRIVANTPPMGYILGDEGSGAVLGKRFLNALYKGRLDPRTREDFEATMQTNLTDVIDRVYRQPLPNRWLASLSPFIHDHLADPVVEAIVVENFSDFIVRNINPYGRRDLPIQAVGSVVFFYEQQLKKAAHAAGYDVGRILRSPL